MRCAGCPQQPRQELTALLGCRPALGLKAADQRLGMALADLRLPKAVWAKSEGQITETGCREQQSTQAVAPTWGASQTPQAGQGLTPQDCRANAHGLRMDRPARCGSSKAFSPAGS